MLSNSLRLVSRSASSRSAIAATRRWMAAEAAAAPKKEAASAAASSGSSAAAAATPASSGSGGGSGAALGVLLAAAAGGYYLKTEIDSLAQECKDVQVQLSGKTNSAFVFIKPHACKGASPEKVQELVESTFAKHGIKVTGSGDMAAEVIDKNMHIDTHYGAIASKAVKLKPSELNVPAKGQAAFEKMFGETWESAIQAGKVYNAKDGAEKLGLDGAGLDKAWAKLTRGKDMIKFGGGFYCGKINDIYVMNGFYMAMRAAYTNPGEKIHWYTVTWPTDALAWEDFRGTVLGATDPTAAPAGSIRRTILDNYQKLGLKSKPNTGDNGVHASASPFEGLAERVNWLGASVEQDAFGKGMLAAGVSKDTIGKWSADCQVSVAGETKDGATMSVFDSLEDLDADASLAKVGKIQ